jgi:uncharacterized RDD family membrane protein YckC
MDEIASSQPPAVYEIANNGPQLFGRGQIRKEILAGRLSLQVMIREQSSANWIPASMVLPEMAHLLPPRALDNQTREPTLLKRACGYVIDAFIVGVPVSILAIGGTLIVAWIPNHENIALLLYVAFVGLGGLAGISYLILAPITPLQGTLGMYAMGLQLKDSVGHPIGLRTSIVRFLVAFCISGIFGVGYLWAFVDGKRRTLHDLIAGTQVVSVRIK